MFALYSFQLLLRQTKVYLFCSIGKSVSMHLFEEVLLVMNHCFPTHKAFRKPPPVAYWTGSVSRCSPERVRQFFFVVSAHLVGKSFGISLAHTTHLRLASFDEEVARRRADRIIEWTSGFANDSILNDTFDSKVSSSIDKSDSLFVTYQRCSDRKFH